MGATASGQKPKAIAVIVDHVTDENNDGAADIEDVKLFLRKNKANRIACSHCRSLARSRPMLAIATWTLANRSARDILIWKGPPE